MSRVCVSRVCVSRVCLCVSRGCTHSPDPEESLCTDGMTHACKIITFSQLLMRAVNMHTYWWICLYRSQMWRTLALTCVLTAPFRPINLPCLFNTDTGYTYSSPAKWYNSQFHWRIQGVGRMFLTLPSRSNFFYFHVVFGAISAK